MKNVSKITFIITSLLASSVSLALQAPNNIYNAYIDASPSFMNADSGFVVLSGTSVKEGASTQSETSNAPLEASTGTTSMSLGDFTITLPSKSDSSSVIFGVSASGSNLPPYAVYNLTTSSIGVMTNRISATVADSNISEITSKYPLKVSYYSKELNTAFFNTSSDPLEFINALKAEPSISNVNMEIIEYINVVN